MSKWTEFVKDFAKRHNLSYGCALSDKRCSQEYKQYKSDELNIPEIPKIIKKKLKEKPKLIPEIQEIPKIIKKKFKEKPKLILEIPEKPLLKIPEKWVEYIKTHNIPDFLENKKELIQISTENLIGIAEYFGLKVPKNPKYSDREKIVNTIVSFTTLPEIQEIIERPEIPKLPDFPRKFFELIKGNDLSIEEGLKSKSILSNITNNDLIKIANILGVKVSKYDDKSKLINKILKFTTS